MTISPRIVASVVSIHAPREGCDGLRLFISTASEAFQFTHPGRGATAERSWSIFSAAVSIHAPREGCDRVRVVV